jgi:hypothetical protein
MTKQRGRTAEYICKNHRCRQPFTARVADRNRGWALYCSKSCKAIAQDSMRHWPDCKEYGGNDGYVFVDGGDEHFDKYG